MTRKRSRSHNSDPKTSPAEVVTTETSAVTLTTPGPAPKDGLRVMALGGLGEVGRNMAVVEYHGKLLLIDCGVLFPEEIQPGVDLILPDFEAIRERLDDVVGLVLTHGHEDHIGAVPYLLREKPDIPLLGSQLTLALVEAKLKEHRLQAFQLRVEEGQTEQVGPFSCQFLAVNHSIPDALAVVVRTPGGTILHTGDFKMDQLPLDGRLTDLRAFAAVSQEGIDLLMVDSTNADVPGFTPAERDIAPALDRVFSRAQRRVIVACFASHVHRVQQVCDAALAHRRKVALVGRSMVRNMGVARQLGYLNVPDDLLVDVRSLEEAPDPRVVLICTGSQGEPMSALSRIANNDHAIKLGSDDVIVLASSLIPGNENAVYRVINGLTRLGAAVVHKGNALVHVSGHASAGELLYFYNVVRPGNVMPVHGEWRHQRANGDLAIATGVPRENVLLADNGTVIDVVDGVARIVGQVPVGFVYVDGSSVGDVTEEALKDRRILRDEGFISIITVVDKARGVIVAGPEVHARGFAEDAEVFDKVTPRVRTALERSLQEGSSDVYQLQQLVRRTVGRWVSEQHRRRPMIVPVVVEV